ncbi:hypothetical protein AX14_009210, partial [Amanita brunnescens Koide BX004]
MPCRIRTEGNGPCATRLRDHQCRCGFGRAPTAQSVSLAGENQQTGLPTNDVLVSYISYGDQ